MGKPLQKKPLKPLQNQKRESFSRVDFPKRTQICDVDRDADADAEGGNFARASLGKGVSGQRGWIRCESLDRLHCAALKSERNRRFSLLSSAPNVDRYGSRSCGAPLVCWLFRTRFLSGTQRERRRRCACTCSASFEPKDIDGDGDCKERAAHRDWYERERTD